jgi:hypothetical protein
MRLIDADKLTYSKIKTNECGYVEITKTVVLEKNIDHAQTIQAIPIKEVEKAIEEFKKEIEENRINVIDYADGEWLVKGFIYGAINRLKVKLNIK